MNTNGNFVKALFSSAVLDIKYLNDEACEDETVETQEEVILIEILLTVILLFHIHADGTYFRHLLTVRGCVVNWTFKCIILPSSVQSPRLIKKPQYLTYSETGGTYSGIYVGYTCSCVKEIFRLHENMCKLRIKI